MKNYFKSLLVYPCLGIVLISSINAQTSYHAAAETPFHKKHAISINVLSPLSNRVGVGYEYLFNPKTSFILQGGLIGLYSGKDIKYDFDYTYKVDPKGYYAATGFQFYLSKKQTNMTGFYVRPMFTYGSYTHNREQKEVIGIGTFFGIPAVYYGKEQIIKEKVTYYTVDLNMGYQFALSESFRINAEIGFGITHDNKIKDDYETFDAAFIGAKKYSTTYSNYTSRSFSNSNTALSGAAAVHLSYIF